MHSYNHAYACTQEKMKGLMRTFITNLKPLAGRSGTKVAIMREAYSLPSKSVCVYVNVLNHTNNVNNACSCVCVSPSLHVYMLACAFAVESRAYIYITFPTLKLHTLVCKHSLAFIQTRIITQIHIHAHVQVCADVPLTPQFAIVEHIFEVFGFSTLFPTSTKHLVPSNASRADKLTGTFIDMHHDVSDEDMVDFDELLDRNKRAIADAVLGPLVTAFEPVDVMKSTQLYTCLSPLLQHTTEYVSNGSISRHLQKWRSKSWSTLINKSPYQMLGVAWRVKNDDETDGVPLYNLLKPLFVDSISRR